MKLKEIFENADAGTTCSGGIAVVSQPIGEVQRRSSATEDTAKYTTEFEIQQRRKYDNARRQFKNSPGN